MLASPELAAQLFQEMSPEQVQEITSEITQIPRLQNRQKIEILSQHMGVKLTPELLANPRLESDLCAAWDAFVRSDARAAVRSLEHFLRSWSKSKAYPQLRRPLDPCKKVGVIFMSLPPEKSARLFSELGPETVQRITLAITQLPTITPKWRRGCYSVNSWDSIPVDTRRVPRPIPWRSWSMPIRSVALNSCGKCSTEAYFAITQFKGTAGLIATSPLGVCAMIAPFLSSGTNSSGISELAP